MPADIMTADIRNTKTRKALVDTMFSLLNHQSFRKITIKEICEEAAISRATFYSHYIDKYDLLQHWLPELCPKNIGSSNNYEQIEKIFNHHVLQYKPVFKNLVSEADNETFGILFDFIISGMNLNMKRDDAGEMFSKNVVLANYLAGGTIAYLLWQIDNRFPSDVPPMNRHLYDMIHGFQSFMK